MTDDTPQTSAPARRAESDILSRAELRLLARKADRYPIKDADRQRAVDVVMDVLDKADSPRHQLAAANTLVAFDKVNQAEVGLLIDLAKLEAPPVGPSVNVSVTNTNAVAVTAAATAQEAMRDPDYVAYLERRALEADRQPGPVREGDDPGVHDPAAHQLHQPEAG